MFITESGIVSLDIISSSMHPEYLTLDCSLICISPYFIFSFLTFFYFESSHKKYRLSFVIAKMDTWLIIGKQSQMLLKSLFSCFSYLYLDRQGMYHQHKEKGYIWQQVTYHYYTWEKVLWYTTGLTCRLRNYIPQIK